MPSKGFAIESGIFEALADPNRFKIVELLRSGPKSVNLISEKLEIRQPQVSKHLKQLAQMGLVVVAVQHRYRYYSLQPKAFISLEKWTHSFEELWSNRLDNLERFLKDDKKSRALSKRG